MLLQRPRGTTGSESGTSKKGFHVECLPQCQQDRAGRGLLAAKPGRLGYEKMRLAPLVVSSLDGHEVEGDRGPCSDLPTNRVLRKSFTGIGGLLFVLGASYFYCFAPWRVRSKDRERLEGAEHREESHAKERKYEDDDGHHCREPGVFS